MQERKPEKQSEKGMDNGLALSFKHEKQVLPLLADVARAQKTGKLSFLNYRPDKRVPDPKNPKSTILVPLSGSNCDEMIPRAVSDLNEMIAHHKKLGREKAGLRDRAQQAAIPLGMKGLQKVFGNQKKDDLNAEARKHHDSSEYYAGSVKKMAEAKDYLLSYYEKKRRIR